MKKCKYIFLSALILSSVYFYSCDDAGLLPSSNPKGQISLSQTNLKPLDQNIDGIYELWIALDTLSQRDWFSAGRFNVTSSGGIIGEGGGSISFNFSGDTTRLHLAAHVLVTLEKDNDGAPSPYRIMSGPLTVSTDSVYGNMNMAGAEALGNVGTVLGAGGAPFALGDYILNSPTTNNAECLKGLWFCDNTGASHFTPGLAMGGGWVYEGWIVNYQTGNFFSLGRFNNFDNADSDGPGSCAGSGTAFNKPGQEFAAGCPPNSSILNNGNFGVFITIEPFDESGQSLTTPFFLKLFRREVIQSSLNCGVRDTYFESMAFRELLPRAYIRMEY